MYKKIILSIIIGIVFLIFNACYSAPIRTPPYNPSQNVYLKEDKMKGISFYKVDRNMKTDRYLYKEIYFYIVKNKNNTYLRFKTKYYDKNWIFYDEVIMLGDNGVKIEFNCSYSNKETDVNSGVHEWCDLAINKQEESTIFKLSEAKSIDVRFSGKYYVDFTMTTNQLLGFKEIIYKYKELKGIK